MTVDELITILKQFQDNDQGQLPLVNDNDEELTVANFYDDPTPAIVLEF